MTIKLRCNDYGYECDLVLDEELTVGLIEKLRDHFEEEHGLDYTIEAVTQMITNRGHSLESTGLLNSVIISLHSLQGSKSSKSFIILSHFLQYLDYFIA